MIKVKFHTPLLKSEAFKAKKTKIPSSSVSNERIFGLFLFTQEIHIA